jgi:hypothetical protein
VAGIFAVNGTTPSQGTQSVYQDCGAQGQSCGHLNDVTAGSNGNCGGSYLCTAGPDYDGPTGLGTPNGALAFQ